MKFRVRYMTAPAVPHVYCRVFAAPNADSTFASLGNLTMRREEFAAFRLMFDEAEFVAEDSQWVPGNIS